MQRKWIFILLLLVSVVSLRGQDFYSSERRADWLLKAEAAKPVLNRTLKKPVGTVSLVEEQTAFQGWKAINNGDMQSFYNQPVNRQSGAVIDFGEHLTGYFTFVVKPVNKTPDAPVRLKFTFGEVPGDLAIPYDPYPGGLSRAWLQDETITVMNIPDTIALPRRMAFRYVKVEVLVATFDFTVSGMLCEAVSSVDTFEPKDTPMPDIIRQIDRVALNTLKECMQTVYEDGPKRDRRLWIGDLYLQALANEYSFKNHELTKRCLYLFAALADESGFINAAVFEKPYPHPQAKNLMYDYSLIFIPSLKNYLEATDDRETAEDLWPVAKKQLETVSLYLQDDYLIDIEKTQRERWIFFDWREELHKEVAVQGMAIFASKQLAELAKLLGKTAEVSGLQDNIRKMTVAARQNYYNKQSGLFVGKLNKQVSVVSQVWMVLSGVASKKEAQKALKALDMVGDVVKTATPYAYHYYIQALIDCGLQTEARIALVSYWGGMVKKGADTFWEAYDPNNDRWSPYNFHPINSYCHAWSCTPVYFIRKYPEIFVSQENNNFIK